MDRLPVHHRATQANCYEHIHKGQLGANSHIFGVLGGNLRLSRYMLNISMGEYSVTEGIRYIYTVLVLSL